MDRLFDPGSFALHSFVVLTQSRLRLGFAGLISSAVPVSLISQLWRLLKELVPVFHNWAQWQLDFFLYVAKARLYVPRHLKFFPGFPSPDIDHCVFIWSSKPASGVCLDHTPLDLLTGSSLIVTR